MALHTGKFIRRSQWTEIPMTHQVKACIEELAAGENWKLTFANKHGQVIGVGPFWKGKAPSNDNSIDNPPTQNKLVEDMDTDPVIVDDTAVAEDIP